VDRRADLGDVLSSDLVIQFAANLIPVAAIDDLPAPDHNWHEQAQGASSRNTANSAGVKSA
jgi:hypothetical protein